VGAESKLNLRTIPVLCTRATSHIGFPESMTVRLGDAILRLSMPAPGRIQSPGENRPLMADQTRSVPLATRQCFIRMSDLISGKPHREERKWEHSRSSSRTTPGSSCSQG
jgi:hypothetical protein